jgi:hypothetical protein
VHIVASYQIDKNNMYRMIRWVEDTLVKEETFSLSGRKALLKSNIEYDVVLIYATESPVERSKKAKALLQLKEKEDPIKIRCCKQAVGK